MSSQTIDVPCSFSTSSDQPGSFSNRMMVTLTVTPCSVTKPDRLEVTMLGSRSCITLALRVSFRPQPEPTPIITGGGSMLPSATGARNRLNDKAPKPVSTKPRKHQSVPSITDPVDWMGNRPVSQRPGDRMIHRAQQRQYRVAIDEAHVFRYQPALDEGKARRDQRLCGENGRIGAPMHLAIP